MKSDNTNDYGVVSPTHHARRYWPHALVLVTLFVVAAKGYLSVRNYRVLGPLDQADFNLYYFAFDTIVHRLGDIGLLYDRQYLLTHLNSMGVGIPAIRPSFFGYPPQFAVLLSPLAYLGLQPAKLVWLVSSAAMFVASMWLLTCLFAGSDSRRRGLLFCLTLVIAAWSAPLYMEVQFGQSNCLILFLLSTGFYAKYVWRNSWLAGVPLGLAIVFKMTPALIPLFFLLRKDWRLAASSGLVALASTLATASVTGWTVLYRYPLDYLPVLTKLCLTHGPAPWNSSFRGAFQRVAEDLSITLPGGVLSACIGVYTVLIVAIVVRMTLRTRANRLRDAAIATLLPLLLSPVVERHHLVLALIPVVAAVAGLWRRMERARLDPPESQAFKDARRSVVKDGWMLLVILLVFVLNPVWISYAIALPALLFCVVRATHDPRDSRALSRNGSRLGSLA